jgi:gliding motility-associated-like protein
MPTVPQPPFYLDTFEGRVDAFHTCGTPELSAPLSDMGYQQPRTGECYIGFDGNFSIYLTNLNNTDSFYIRSYPQGKLEAELESGVEYNFSVWLSLAEAGSKIESWQLGLRLSPDRVERSSYFSNLTTPLYWENDSGNWIDGECDEWIQITGSFTAQGGERYFQFGSTIGNRHIAPDTLHRIGDACYQRYDSLFHVLAGHPPGATDRGGHNYYFMDDFAIWRADAEIYVANAGEDGFACKNEEVTLGSPTREQYRSYWLSTAGDTLATTGELTVAPNQTTSYILSQWDFRFIETRDTVTLYIEEDCLELTLPNVFTPNGDGYNDTWAPLSEDATNYEITIYNRWGTAVHQYTGPANTYPGWNGENQTEGTFFVTVKAQNAYGYIVEETGQITLLK